MEKTDSDGGVIGEVERAAVEVAKTSLTGTFMDYRHEVFNALPAEFRLIHVAQTRKAIYLLVAGAAAKLC